MSSSEMIVIEQQDARSPVWYQTVVCSNNSYEISNWFKVALQRSHVQRVRAVGQQSGRLYDMMQK